MKEGSNNSDKIGCSRSGDAGKGLFETKRNKHIVQPVYGGPFVLYINTHYAQQGNYNFSAYNQQLPIKEKSARQQVQVVIEKKASLYGWHSFQNNLLFLYSAGSMIGETGTDQSVF